VQCHRPKGTTTRPDPCGRYTNESALRRATLREQQSTLRRARSRRRCGSLVAEAARFHGLPSKRSTDHRAFGLDAPHRTGGATRREVAADLRRRPFGEESARARPAARPVTTRPGIRVIVGWLPGRGSSPEPCPSIEILGAPSRARVGSDAFHYRRSGSRSSVLAPRRRTGAKNAFSTSVPQRP
jgi:hypothetical protein